MAQVVDVDNNGDPNDAGAMWTPGETFTDAANGITVTVNAQTATGFQVTIKRGAAGAWVSRASMPTARRALAVAAANGLVFAIGGANGSGTVLRTVRGLQPQHQPDGPPRHRSRRLGRAAMVPSPSTGSCTWLAARTPQAR